MTYQEKLCRFMEAKQGILNEHLARIYQKEPFAFFTDQDRQVLLSLSDEAAKDAWANIKESVQHGSRALYRQVQPFCVIFVICWKCPYQKARGDKHCAYRPGWEEREHIGYKFLTNKVHKKIIEDIEGKKVFW
jgi:hypothetical protein